MVTAGISVDVLLFHWISTTALDHRSFFIKGSHDWHLLNKLIRDGQNNLSNFSDQDIQIIHDFSRWFFVLILLFDGGIFSESIHSLTINNGIISVAWQNNIHHKISTNEWNRHTCLALDYIGSRAHQLTKASKHLGSSLQSLIQYLNYYKTLLDQHISFYSSYSISSPIEDLIKRDKSVLFILLSVIPSHNLQAFYIKLADLFSEPLSINFFNKQVYVNQLFLQPSPNDLFVLEKVKTHYNLMFYSKIDDSLKNDCFEMTMQFVQEQLRQPQIKHRILTDISEINTTILIPRSELVSMVVKQFDWPLK